MSSVDSIDTRSLRKEAFSMLRSGQAIDKTLKWTMRTKLKSRTLPKVSINVEAPTSIEPPILISSSVPSSPEFTGRRSPVHSPSLERRTTFTQSGLSHNTREETGAVSAVIDAPMSAVTIQGKPIPSDIYKGAMVEVFRKENAALRETFSKSPVKSSRKQLEMTDDASYDSRMQFYDSISSSSLALSQNQSQFMRTTEAKQVAKLADPREEANAKWKKMKKQRDERDARIARRKAREEMMYNVTRVVVHADQSEFHRAYRDQYMQQEYLTKRKHQERVEDRRKLDENMRQQQATRRKQQLDESKFMKTMLRESARQAREAHLQEITLMRMNNELNGTVSRSQSCLDTSSTTKVNIPEQLQNKVKTAKTLAEFEEARKNVKEYYQDTLSERIGEYARSRKTAISTAGSTDTRLTLSPIRGADLFQDSFTSQDFDAYNIQELIKSRLNSGRPPIKSQTNTPNDLSSIRPMTPSPPRPNTADFVLKEYFASRTIQQELFDLESFSLHSSESVSGMP